MHTDKRNDTIRATSVLRLVITCGLGGVSRTQSSTAWISSRAMDTAAIATPTLTGTPTDHVKSMTHALRPVGCALRNRLARYVPYRDTGGAVAVAAVAVPAAAVRTLRRGRNGT